MENNYIIPILLLIIKVILVALLLFSLYHWGKRNTFHTLKIYPIIFAVSIVCFTLFEDIISKTNSCLISSWFSEYFGEFIGILICVLITFFIVNMSRKQWKTIISKGLFPSLVTLSIFLLIIYICMSEMTRQDGHIIHIKGGLDLLFSEDKNYKTFTLHSRDKTSLLIENAGNNSSGESLAIVSAIIAGCFTLYTVQRTSKQESTKNRQTWITNVRNESATLIATMDKIKLYELSCAKCYECYANSCSSNNASELYMTLIDTCAKLRMLLNPGDLFSPFLIVQLDIIISEFSGKTIDISHSLKASKNIRCNFRNIDLRKSFMPWIQILLKTEWERIKATLESREITAPDYYSNTIFCEEWTIDKYEQFGVSDIFKQTYRLIKEMGDKEELTKDYIRKIVRSKSKDNEIRDLQQAVFPGFYFIESETVEIIYCLINIVRSNNSIMRYCSHDDSTKNRADIK